LIDEAPRRSPAEQPGMQLMQPSPIADKFEMLFTQENQKRWLHESLASAGCMRTYNSKTRTVLPSSPFLRCYYPMLQVMIPVLYDGVFYSE